MEDATLLDQAFKAWERDCEKEGAIHDQPSNASFERTVGDVEYAILTNVNGVLAVYAAIDGKLQRVEDYPKSLEQY